MGLLCRTLSLQSAMGLLCRNHSLQSAMGVLCRTHSALSVFSCSGWGRFGALRGSFWCFFSSSTHRFYPSTRQLVASTHQLINLSTHHPMALRHFLTRPGGLRAARLNPPPPEGSERVQTVFRISLSNSSNSKSLARPRAVCPRARTQFPGPPKSVPNSVQNRSKN